MAFEPPPNIMKAGERPAKIRTGAKTATKTQERETLEKLGYLADHPEVLVPEWLGEGRNPFDALAKKLLKVQSLRGKPRRLRWTARGKNLWNGYAVCFIVLAGQKVPSFASIKFRNRDLKFVYRSGTARNALIGVQHYDDPEARLLGYHRLAKKHKAFLLSGEKFIALRRGDKGPIEFAQELFDDAGVRSTVEGGSLRCAHVEPTTWRYEYEVPDLAWRVEFCMDCVKTLGGSLRDRLDRRILGPAARTRVEPKVRGHAYTLRPDASVRAYDALIERAFAEAHKDADAKYESYSDLELAQWTKEHLLEVLQHEEGGFLLVGDDLWLADFDAAADAYVDSDLERRALKRAFALRAPKLRVSDKSLHKILEPYWKEFGRQILGELSAGLLKEKEVEQIARLNPSEALASLARILGSRQRFKEFLQFDDLPAPLEFLVTCLQIQRSGEHGVLSEKLHAGAKEPATKILALSLARAFGAQANLEWQYMAHEKDGANFLDPFVREVVNANPRDFAVALGKLAQAMGIDAPGLPKPSPAPASEPPPPVEPSA